MFKNRIIKIVLLTILIALFMLYSFNNRPERALTFRDCLMNPERYDRRELLIGNETRIGEIFENSFEIWNNKGKIMVVGPTEGLKKNEYVSLKATFHKTGYLTLEKVHVHRYRRLKIAISIIPAVLVIVMFLRKYKLNPKRMILAERKCQI